MKTKIHQFITDLIISLLNVGVVLATSHGVYALAAAESYFNHVEFVSKVQTDQHTHTEAGNTFKAINHHYVDPKSLRKIRSEGDKAAEGDRTLNGWDVYRV
jgi:hypothetical protein